MDGRTWKFINSNLFRPKNNLHNMIMPIYTFGQPVLRKVAEDIDKDYPNLEQLIKDM